MSQENDKNTKVFMVGFILIILIFAFTLAKPYLFKSNKPANTSQTAPLIKDNSGITSSDLEKKIIDKDPMVIIDIRSADDFNTSHIVDSKNISASDLDNAVITLDKTKNYILVDDSGDPSMITLAQMVFPEKGFGKTYYLIGGITAWINQDYPVVEDADPNSTDDQAKVNYISSDELKKEIDQNVNLYIIDLRSAENFATGHINNSVNIFLGDLEKRRGEIPMGKKIVLVDKDGLWAFKGAVQLFDMGTFNVYALSDGLDAWQQKGYEIVK